jgi:hypothetical protein
MKVVDALNLSYHTVRQLNEIIDTKLPGRPRFERKELDIGGEHLDFYCRDILECIRSLYGDPQFTQDLAFTPERHYTSHERTSRIYNEMYTGDWWWSVQVRSLYSETNESILSSGFRHPLKHVNQGVQLSL